MIIALTKIFEYFYIPIIILLVLITLSVLLWCKTYSNKLPKNILLLCLISFIMSIFWIWFIANNLIDVIKSTGVIFNIPPVYLGMTLLALGNSVPGIICQLTLDLTLNVSLAKTGYGEMGVAGSIAGPLFNILVGLGATLLKSNIVEG